MKKTKRPDASSPVLGSILRTACDVLEEADSFLSAVTGSTWYSRGSAAPWGNWSTRTHVHAHTQKHTHRHTRTETHTLLIHTRTHGHTHRYTWTQTHTHTINTHIHTHTLSLLIPETRAPDHSEREEPAREGRHLLGARAAVQRRQTLHSPDTRSLLPLPSSPTGCQPVLSHAQHPPAWTGLDTLCPSLFTTVPPSFPPGNIAPGPE